MINAIFGILITCCFVAVGFKSYYVYKLEQVKGGLSFLGLFKMFMFWALPYYNIPPTNEKRPIIKKINTALIAFWLLFAVAITFGVLFMPRSGN